MVNIVSENIGDLAIIECEGSITEVDSANRFRATVMSQRGVRTIVVDLSEVKVIAAFGVDMLSFLQRWAHDKRISLKFFNPTNFVRDKLQGTASFFAFEFSSLPEMMAILGEAQREHRLAA